MCGNHVTAQHKSCRFWEFKNKWKWGFLMRSYFQFMGCISNWTSTSCNKQGPKAPSEWGNSPILQVPSGHVGGHAWRSLHEKAQSSGHCWRPLRMVSAGTLSPLPPRGDAGHTLQWEPHIKGVLVNRELTLCSIICPKITWKLMFQKTTATKKTNSNFLAALTILTTKILQKIFSWINKPLLT